MADSGMDGLDAMMASLATEPTRKKTAPKKELIKPKTTLPKNEKLEPSVQPETKSVSPQVQHFCDTLRQFSLDLADPETRDKINNALAQKPYEALAEYYETRPELAKYTVEQEVTRMDYTVIPIDGASISDTSEIQQFYSGSFEEQDSILWRFANQSVLADLMMAIREHMVEPHDPHGALCICVRNVSVSFVLNFAKQTMESVCVFTIATVSADSPAGLILGKITGTVELCCKENAKSLRQTVGALQLEVVFDDAIAEAAKVVYSIPSWYTLCTMHDARCTMHYTPYTMH
jgi:hypothetical protein